MFLINKYFVAKRERERKKRLRIRMILKISNKNFPTSGLNDLLDEKEAEESRGGVRRRSSSCSRQDSRLLSIVGIFVPLIGTENFLYNC